MLVRILGISFEPKAIVTLDELFDNLSKLSDKEILVGDINRLLVVDKDSNEKYYLGVVVTIKDQRRFCELSKEQGKIKIKVVNLEDHQSIMEFNFFVINKTSGLGLYQHYHQSCSIGQFAHLVSKRYRDIADGLAEEEIAQNEKIDEKKIAAIRKKYSGRLDWSVLVRKEALENLLLELSLIKSFEFDFMHLESKEPEYQPLSGKVRKERRKLSFVRNTFSHFVAHKISVLANKLKISSGRVIGEDEDGISRAIKIMDNPDNYGEYPYDDVAAKLHNLDLSSISDSWVIIELLEKAMQYKAFFEAKTQ